MVPVGAVVERGEVRVVTCQGHQWRETTSDIVQRCAACGLTRYLPSEDMDVYYAHVAASQDARMSQRLGKVMAAMLSTVEQGEKLRRLADQARGHLDEQHFWAHPPPYVDEDSRSERDVGKLHSGARVIMDIVMLRLADKHRVAGEVNASLELYKRYKYGHEERKYFRNVARRMAAKCMVKWWLA